MDGLFRRETDLLGGRDVPKDALFGIHALRASENFQLAGRLVHPALVRALGDVKLACARVNRRLGVWDADGAAADAIERACEEMSRGELLAHVAVDALQGGAGTATNMAVNEVIANRALQLLGEPLGHYERVSPHDDINRHQSTNDVFPTALRIAAIRGVRALEAAIVRLQAAFQDAERRLAHVVKVGRTEMQDAALVTLGREMGAYAEALGRDRWRVYKCEERLRVVNLGGTAVGTGLGAPRRFVFEAVDEARAVTGLGLARAENLFEATQNQDALVETSSLLRTHATTLLKITADLRLLSSGPDAGFGEIVLPAVAAGSSIMPGKVNPVIPEAAAQAAMWAIGLDQTVAIACASGSLELNAFLPVVAEALLGELDVLTAANDMLAARCIAGIAADESRCRAHVLNATATVTALVPRVGYEQAQRVAALAKASGRGVRDVVLELGLMSAADFDAAIAPDAVMRLGSPGEGERP